MFSKYELSLIVTLSMLVVAPFPVDALEDIPTTGSNASQEQSSTQDLVNAPVQSITFPTSTPLRSFSVPGASPTPSLPVPAHFAPPVTDGNFGNLASILAYKDLFNLDDAEALLQNHGDIRVITTCYIPERLRTPQKRLRIVPEPKDKEGFKNRYEAIGIGNYKATESNTISEQVLGIAVKEGLQIGADLMIFQEGASLAQQAKGFSIGLFNSFSYVNSGSDSAGAGNVSVGGLGYGKGESSYSSKPWLRVQFFRERPVPAAKNPTEPLKYQNSQNGKEPEPSDSQTTTPTPEEIYLIKPLENPSSMAPTVIRTPSLTTVVPPPVMKTQRPALTIREIVTNTSNIEIRANQAINSYKTMELTSPDRLVIDFPSDSVNQEAASVAINKFGISKLRIGVSPQNIRMVLDSKESGLPAYKLEMAAEGLKIVFEDELQMISYKRENH